MNIYVVTEGPSEKKVFKSWIRQVNPSISPVETIDKVKNNNFYIVSGGGYPQYLDVIDAAIFDVISIYENATPLFNRLVICADSEDYTFKEKLQEIKNHVHRNLAGKKTKIDIKIIIQHYCFESWCLANPKIVTRNIKIPELSTFLKHFNVKDSDPEKMPSFSTRSLNRAQFSEEYLRLLFQNKNITYSKGNPRYVQEPTYFEQLKKRYDTTNHIQSFGEFLKAFL